MAAMRTTLLLMLLFAALATAQATSTRTVSCQNKCPKSITVNGIQIAAGAIVDIPVVASVVACVVVDVNNVPHQGTFWCPPDVTELVVVYESLFVKVTVGGVVSIVGLVGTLLDAVLGLLGPCTL